MAETIQMNLNVLPITKERIFLMAEAKRQWPGGVVDLMVEEAWAKFSPTPKAAETITVSAETVEVQE